MSDASPPIKPGPLAWMAANPVVANLLMAIFLIGGFLSVSRIEQEVFPEFDLDMVTIAVLYPGAGPAEVEQGVVLSIEEAVRSLDDVKMVRSTSSEGLATVVVELSERADANQSLADIKSAVDRIASFPADAEKPIVSMVSNRMENITLAVYGDLDEWTLRSLAENIRDELLDLPEITLAELGGVRPYEIGIEISQENLRRYGLTLEAAAQRVAAASVELPGGGVRTERGEVLLRTTERRVRGKDFETITLAAAPDGGRVTVRDIARVNDGFRETDQEARFNGRPAALVRVYRTGRQTPIDVSEAVHAYVAQKTLSLPPNVGLATLGDRSEMFRDRVNLLLRNGFLGIVLVLLTLGIFLELRVAFWVTVGMVTAFAGALLFMPWAGVSINMITLFAFIVVLGVVVDDAVVAGEAIFEQRLRGKGLLEASILGIREVANPITFSVLTTIAAFLPLLFVPGAMGKFFGVIPVIVILVLFLSLFEALYILPSHIGHAGHAGEKGFGRRIHAVQQRFTHGLIRFIRTVYQPALVAAVRYRYFTFGLALAVLLVSFGMVAGKRIDFTFMPRIDTDRVIATVRMPFGTPAEETRAAMEHMLATADAILEEAGGVQRMSRGIFAQVGATGGGRLDPMGGSEAALSHVAEVIIFLVPSDARPLSAGAFARRWREGIGEIPGVEHLSFVYSAGPSSGSAIDLELSHTDSATLEAAAARLAEAYGQFLGVHDIDAGFSPGKEQLDFRLRPAAHAAGLTELDLARQVRGAFHGVEAVRQQRGREEVRTFVRLPLHERQSEYFVENFVVRAPSGGEIPLLEAAEVTRGRSYTEIQRVDGKRVVNVTADVTEGVANANQVVDDVLRDTMPGLLQDFPGLTWAPGGQQRSQGETFDALRANGILALILIFALLAIPFRSYVQPFIVISAIPFGFVGALLGHILLGYGLSLVSLLGVVAVSGIVVNASLVLVHAINRYRGEGMALDEAILAGGMRRFRPILLTSLTTFFGLLPMMLETSVQARFLIPMAISLAFGVLISAAVTLFLVPALYRIVEDMRGGVDAGEAQGGNT